MNTERAKSYLLRMLTDPALKNKLPVSLLVSTGKQIHGLTRAELKAARKELGAISENIDGTQVWYLPGERET